MSYGIHLNGLPHGDSLNSYTDREAREERYQAAREKRERFGEAGERKDCGSGQLLRLPSESELSQGSSRLAIDLPTVEELERAAAETARVGNFHGWLAEKAKELGLYRE